MEDLKIAMEMFENSDDSLIIVKDRRILLSKKGGGIGPLFDACCELGGQMKGSSIADKVVGKAAAALCVYAGIKRLYTPVLSSKAISLLEKNGIDYTTDKLTPGILNKDRSDFCPLEKMTEEEDEAERICDIVKGFVRGTAK